MPRLMDIAREVLGETVSNLLNHENCHSVDEFLLRYKAVKEANQHTIGEQNISLLRSAIISKYRPLVKSSQNLSQKALENTIVLSTGSARFDKLLGAGLYTCEVTEVFGRSGCGKTQLALHVSALACLKHRAHVLYIDSSNCFCAERMVEIMHKLKATEELVDRMMKKIKVCSAYDVYELHNILFNLLQCRKQKSDLFSEKVKLVVIDNITSLLTVLLGYKCSEGYKLVNSISSLLRRIAREQHIAIMVINNTVTGTTSNKLPKAALGVQWQHTADKRVLISGYDDSSTDLYHGCLVSSSNEGFT